MPIVEFPGQGKEGLEESLDGSKAGTLVDREVACYVLITCKEPGPNGEMEVEMTYEGPEALAAFLLKSGQGYFEDQDE